jgi:hypothetical protein
VHSAIIKAADGWATSRSSTLEASPVHIDWR